MTITRSNRIPMTTKTIKVYNPVYERKHIFAASVYIPEYNVYTGTVVPNPKWVANDCLCLNTEENPLRIILKKNIVGYLPKVEEKTNQIKTWQYTNSKGKVYTISNDNGRFECDCLGFQFRRSCKHIVQAKEKI